MDSQTPGSRRDHGGRWNPQARFWMTLDFSAFLSSTYFDQSYARAPSSSPPSTLFVARKYHLLNPPAQTSLYPPIHTLLYPSSISSFWASTPPYTLNAGVRTDLYLRLPFRKYRFSVFLLRRCITPHDHEYQ